MSEFSGLLLNGISGLLLMIYTYKHGINYWSFSATSTKKANVYEKLLKRWMSRNTMAFKYDRVGNDFYVYVENNFND